MNSLLKNFFSQTGKQFKNELIKGNPKMGLFLNSSSPTVCEQFSNMGYDWLLVDCQHGPMNYNNLSNCLSAIDNGKSLSMTRVGGYQDKMGIQQALDLGSKGILIPYINNKSEAMEAVSSCLYPQPSKLKGTRSVYHPQRSNNKDGLLGYVGNHNDNVVVSIQIETEECINNLDEILSIKEIDIAFLGQNDLCLSMGLFEKYQFPDMYFSKELNDATDKIIKTCKKYNKIPGIFLFGTDRVGEFINKGFNFVSVGNDLHHMNTQAQTHINNLKTITKENNKIWTPQNSNLI